MGICYNAKENFESFTLYMNEAAMFPLLTEEEERELFKKFTESTGKEKEMYRTKIAESNLKLVISIAKKYKGLGLEIQDLVSEGNLGLMSAIERFDYSIGNKFSTYAVWWIKQAIQRAVTDKGRTIRIPVHAYEKIQKIRRFEYLFEKKNDRLPTIDEIKEETGFTKQQIETLKKQSQAVLSLDAEIPNTDKREGHRASLGDWYTDTNEATLEEKYLIKDMQRSVNEVLDCLKDKEYEIISLRYGLADDKPRTLEEIGNIYGVTRERIRQIEVNALRKLKFAARKKGLRDYL